MSKPWRSYPQLQGRFHPDNPDDLQVLAHDGGPRTTQASPELVWVQVIGMADETFVGTVLNEPTQLMTVAEGDQLLFVVPEHFDYPIMVTTQYLAERSRWSIQPCSSCGLDELFDPPSRLLAQIFPDVPGELRNFTAICPACGGAQAVERRQSKTQPPSKPWWVPGFLRT